MNKEKVIDIVDFEKEYVQLQDKIGSIERNLQAFQFDYANKISGKFDTYQISSTRTDLTLKLNSIMYIVRLMNQEKMRTVLYLENQLIKNGNDLISDSLNLIQNQKTLFDSILYHVSSVYDYYAILSDYLYNYKSSLKWNGLVKSAHNITNSKISPAHKEFITKSHKEFVNSIFSHRSYLIHSGTSNAGYRITRNTKQDKITIELITPHKFIKEFKELELFSEGRPISLEASLFWILNKGLSNIISLIYGLKTEINNLRKIDAKDAIIFDSDGSSENLTERMWVIE